MSDDLSIPNPDYRGSRAGRYGNGQSRLRPGMDPDTRRLMVFAGGLGVVLIALIGASSLIGHRSTEVPVVAADGRPIRVKPENPGGMKIDGAENDLFSGASDTANARLSAASETPDTRTLHTVAAPPPPVVDMPAPAALVPPPALVNKPIPAASVPTARIAPVVPPKPPAPAVIETRAPATTETRPPAAVEARPPAVAETHPPASGQQAMVQLAAVASEEGARNEWQLMVKRMPDLLNGRQPVYSRTERDGRTFWRVRTAGFADVAQARTFCDRIRLKGAGCSVADF